MKLRLSLLVCYAAMINATLPPLDLKKIEQDVQARKKEEAQNLLKQQEKDQKEQTETIVATVKESLTIQAKAKECLNAVTQLVHELEKQLTAKLETIATQEGHATIMYHRLTKNHALRDQQAVNTIAMQIIKLQNQAEGFLNSLKIIEKNCLDFLQHINEEHPPKRPHGPGESA